MSSKGSAWILRLRCLFYILLLTLVDQLSKAAASSRLKNRAIPLIPGILELRYLENRGAAFGLMPNKQWLFIMFALVICCAVIYIYPRILPGDRYALLRIIACLLGAGAVGNLIDRIRLGYVIDFLYLRIIDFPIFNVADIYITLCSLLLILGLLFIYKDEEVLR